MGVVAVRGIVFHMGGGDGDAALLLFRRVVDLVEAARLAAVGLRAHLGERRRQRGFAVVNMAYGAYVDMNFGSLEFFFSHVTASVPVSVLG